MSITKDAIQHIEQSETVKSLNEELAKSNLVSESIIIPDGYNLRSLDHLQAHKAFYSSSFSTNSIPDFVEYSKEFDKENAKCFIDKSTMSAKAIFDIGSEDMPLHKLNNASLSLERTMAFKAVRDICSLHLSQRDAANFIEDWADLLTVETIDGVEIKASVASKKICDLTVESARSLQSEQGDFNNSMSAMERVEVKNSELMPAIIAFKCMPYLGLKEREVLLRISIITSGEKPKVSMRIMGYEKMIDEITEEFKDILVEKFSDFDMGVFMGNFS